MGTTAPGVWRRDVATAVACISLGWVGFGRGAMVPVLGHVDLGIHELGHLLAGTLPVGEAIVAVAGSALQVAVPLLLAIYFLVLQRDRVGGAICLAWSATSASDVARYVADAADPRLSLLGGEHDWVFILDHLDRLDQAATLASAVRGAGLVLLTAALVVCGWPAVRAAWVAAPDLGPSGPATVPIDPGRPAGGRSPV